MQSVIWGNTTVGALNVGDEVLVQTVGDKYLATKVEQVAVNTDETVTLWLAGRGPITRQEDETILIKQYVE